jgi:predicted RNA-binding protein (virulence factor B family)
MATPVHYREYRTVPWRRAEQQLIITVRPDEKGRIYSTGPVKKRDLAESTRSTVPSWLKAMEIPG